MPRVPPKDRTVSWAARPRLSGGDAKKLGDEVEAGLLAQVDELKEVEGDAQAQGNEAGGPALTTRREALSVLLSRMSLQELEAQLPKRGRKIWANLRRDLDWLNTAERQDLGRGKPFDFSWSSNPMSTPSVLTELAARRHAAASAAAQDLQADPDMAFDASNDSLLCHLQLDAPSLRAQVLADTLIQFRAQRRSEGLMDAALAPDNDDDGQSKGRIGSSGTVSSYEQRLALSELKKSRSFDNLRESALVRMIVGGAMAGSVNNIYAGRNAVASLPAFMGFGVQNESIGDGDGLQSNFHDAIHKSYSANTANAVEHYLKERVFIDGDIEHRPAILRGLTDAASATNLDEAQKILAGLKERYDYEVPDAASCTSVDKLQSHLLKYLKKQTDVRGLKTAHPIGLLKSLKLILLTYQAVVLDRPSVNELRSKMFYAGKAWPDVAKLVGAMETGDQAQQLEAVGRAREGLGKAFFATKSPYERQMIARLDRRIELLATEIIGNSVETVLATGDDAVGEGLLAVHSALKNVVASGMHNLRARPKTAPVEDLPELLKKVESMLGDGKASVADIRDLMTTVFTSSQEVADAMSGFFRRREAAIHFSDIDIDLDPDFIGNLVKESPLQHLLSLSNHLRSLDRKTEISSEEIRFVGGMRVLNSTGPRVYKRILVAKTPAALARYKPTLDDLCVVQSTNEKNLVYGGGIIVDTKDAGPGLSHAAVLAKGHGINAIALPNLGSAIDTFFRKAAGDTNNEAGFYVDPRPESFVIKPVASAVSEGLIDAAAVNSLRPGYNLDVDYFDVTEAAGKVQRVLIDEQSLHLSDHHETRQIDLIVPDTADKLDLQQPLSFDALSELHIDQTRQAAGEKGAVLVDLSRSTRLAELGVTVPPGGVVPPFEVADLLRNAQVGNKSLFDLWTATPDRPSFADKTKRPALLTKTKKTSAAALTDSLIQGSRPTPEGKALLAVMEQKFGLNPKGDWIFRSSFTAEDRPFKSGAGQYDSVVVPGKPASTSNKRRIEALAQVISSAWNTSAVESNLQSGLLIEHVWPAVVVQQALKPTISGVGISRGMTGGFGECSYQATPKFGGGVDGGPCEEGVLSSSGQQLNRKYDGKDKSLLSKAQQDKLHAAMMAIEEDFNERIEPGQKFAVDVEWAFVKNKLHILQARVITGV